MARACGAGVLPQIDFCPADCRIGTIRLDSIVAREMKGQMHDLDVTNANVAIVADMLEEGWPSMDLVAEMLVSAQNQQLPALDGGRQAAAATITFVCHLVRPPMRRRFSQSGQTTGRGYTI